MQNENVEINKYYKCKSHNHHTAICDKDEQRNPPIGNGQSTDVNMVDAKTSILLQTASGIISDTKENQEYVS